MKIVFMGTPEFSAEFLRHLIKSKHEVAAVVTQCDSRSGRGMELKQPPVKTAALQAGIPVLQPSSIKSLEFIEELKKIEADIFVVVAFSILPKEVLAASKFGAVNVHGSLLPKYRGAAPVQWAIANNEQTTGLTIFLLDEKIDHGPILEQRELTISQNDTTETLLNKMITPGCEALDCALLKIQNNSFTPIEQNHSESSSAPKLKKEDALVNWNLSAMQIFKRLCAFTPWPGAYTTLNSQKVFLRSMKVVPKEDFKEEVAPGRVIVQKRNVFAGTGDGVLELLEIQAEGKKRMSATDYFRGVAGDCHFFGNSLSCPSFKRWEK